MGFLLAVMAKHNPLCRYRTKNMKFGEIDIARWPEAAKKFDIDTSATSLQVPSLILFEQGKEHRRLPPIQGDGSVKAVKLDRVITQYGTLRMLSSCRLTLLVFALLCSLSRKVSSSTFTWRGDCLTSLIIQGVDDAVRLGSRMKLQVLKPHTLQLFHDHVRGAVRGGGVVLLLE